MTAIGDYDVGDLVNLFVTFTDAEDQIGDPDTVELVVRHPSGLVETFDSFPEHVAASGYYEYAIEADAVGEWHAEWRGTGTITATEQINFRVRRSYVRDPGAFTTP